MIFDVFLLVISWEEKSKVLLDPEIFFNDSVDWRMKLSDEDELTLDSEWDAINVDSFIEKELECFFFLSWRFSMIFFEDDEVKLDDEEGRWLDSVFKSCEESLGDLKSVGWSSLE